MEQATLNIQAVPGVPRRIDAEPGATVRVRSGVLWITQSGDPEDHFLGPGEHLRLCGGRVVIEAQGHNRAACQVVPATAPVAQA